MQLQAMIGLAAAIVLLPILVEHIKAAVKWAITRGRALSSSPWQLVTDALAVLWSLALWDSGLLVFEEIAELRLTTVVLIGLALGAAASGGYDLLPNVIKGLARTSNTT